jgi:hypothetical protein
MTIREPIKLRDIDNYLEDLTAIAQTTSKALTLCLRARMAVSAGAQNAVMRTSLKWDLCSRRFIKLAMLEN